MSEIQIYKEGNKCISLILRDQEFEYSHAKVIVDRFGGYYFFTFIYISYPASNPIKRVTKITFCIFGFAYCMSWSKTA